MCGLQPTFPHIVPLIFTVKTWGVQAFNGDEIVGACHTCSLRDIEEKLCLPVTFL